MANQFAFKFAQGQAEGNSKMKEALGGKGANLAEMCNLGLPIPPGMTISTDMCVDYMKGGESVKTHVVQMGVNAALAVIGEIEEKHGLGLYSVRSGARVSMPGMMDTILNLGITLETLPKYEELLGKRAALDCFRRLIQMYGEVVIGIPPEYFSKPLAEAKSQAKVEFDSELSAEWLMALVHRYLKEYQDLTGDEFPKTLKEQLTGAIEAVFQSWNSERAIAYRKANNIPNDWGTAVNVQRMVFGNLNDQSATGVLFTRNPKNGVKTLYGEFLVNAQGEDVVAGIRTPEPLTSMVLWDAAMFCELDLIADKMEKHYRDMQDMEFTVENGKLWILQTRTGKRSAQAAFRIAYDMVEEGMITKAEALKRITAKQYSVLTKPQIDPEFHVKPSFVGIPASNGIVSGKMVFSKEDAIASSEPCILVRHETTPDDYPGMLAAVGILTTTGGATSHAAVVARGMDKPCVVGCTEFPIKELKKHAVNTVTIDGATGRVWVNTKVPVVTIKLEKYVREMLDWALEGKNFTPAVSPKFGPAGAGPIPGSLESIPESGQVVVRTDGIVNDNSYAQTDMANILKVLKSRTKLSGVIDLTSKGATPEDSQFMYFLGTDGVVNTDNKKKLSNLLKTLEQKQWTQTMKAYWVLQLPESVNKETQQKLRELGWRLVSRVASMSDLMTADGMVHFDAQFYEQMKIQGVDAQELLAIFKKAGRSLDPVPVGVPKESMVLAALNS